MIYDNNTRYHILNNFEPKIQIKFTKIQRLPTNFPKVRFRFEPLYNWLNLELDLGFGSAKTLNLELNFGFGPRGSGSNLGSELNFGITRRWFALQVCSGCAQKKTAHFLLD
jgi:hypothetical protein